MGRSPFKRYVEIGRVCLINYGKNAGKLCVIIDVVDQSRALIDGPSSVNGVKRQIINLRRLSLTDITIKITRGARLKNLVKVYNAEDVETKWKESKWCQKLELRKTRANATDFDRYRIQQARTERSVLVRDALKKQGYRSYRNHVKAKSQ
eukprot:TRINITY_DN136279_c0_g1_i1.p1 TRINITY_DN136279_c0_g1~~TRINITY_DN136279_c0_g1_i1.p1  ORF type:complete len:150 (-),score=30.89 TRINITY_DN136279_c0_g1_i1:107-556(-)